MYSHDDPKIIWVSSKFNGKCNGTFEAPYTDIRKAVMKARPGSMVVLLPGDYTECVNIENCGTITEPIRIVSEDGCGDEVCCRSGWFFYDVSDVIVSGITFRNIAHQAVSVIGACKRNSFNNLRFVNCGVDKGTPCTFFFGGSGAQCNVVENCIFEIDRKKETKGEVDLPIGLMISEGDTQADAEQNKNHIFRKNSFVNYGCAIVVGTRDQQNGSYNHIVENNVIQNCSGDGIRIKCGDTFARGNILQKCKKNGISIVHGRSDVISDNRIEECESGIYIAGYDCTLSNNCIIKSGKQAVFIATKSAENKLLRGNTIIEKNTFVDSGIKCGTSSCSDILLDTNTNCIIRRNIFHGKGKPYIVRRRKKDLFQSGVFLIDDNKISGGCFPAEGCNELPISFPDKKAGNYANQSGYGACGWVVESSEIPLKVSSEVISYKPDDYPNKRFIEENLKVKDQYIRSFFTNTENGDSEEPEDPFAGSRGDDGIIDFSDWDI